MNSTSSPTVVHKPRVCLCGGGVEGRDQAIVTSLFSFPLSPLPQYLVLLALSSGFFFLFFFPRRDDGTVTQDTHFELLMMNV